MPNSSAPGTLDPSAARIRRHGGAGSRAGSDTDTDGAAMSDASRARRIKLKVGGSPPAQPTSRSGSPTPATAPRPIAFPSEQDIRNAIPSGGVTVKDLVLTVPHPPARKNDFVALIKAITRFDKEKGLLFPK